VELDIRTAFKSLSTSFIFRQPELPGYLAGLSTIYSTSPPRSKTPSLTILNDTISAPSSKMLVEVGGIDPGRIPPMSAWCPREAVKKIISLLSDSNTGVIIVMSGRCLEKSIVCIGHRVEVKHVRSPSVRRIGHQYISLLKLLPIKLHLVLDGTS
jgi:hypothetical protein